MANPSYRDIVRKADLTVQDLVDHGGYLSAEQADRFVRLMQAQPTMLAEARRVVMGGPVRKINKIGFDSRILNPAPESGVTLESADRAKPVTEQITLTSKEVIAEVHIPYDLLEDNVEKGSLENTIMEEMAARTAVDLEELLIKGDTTSDDPFLALSDGVLKLVTTNTVDLTGTADISKEVFKSLIKEMDAAYLRNRSAFRFYCSHKNETDYRDALADRMTDTGDGVLTGKSAAYAYGIPVLPSDLMPEDSVFLTNPKNLVWGIQRDIMIEADKDIRARVLILVLTMRVAFAVEEEKAAVVAANLGQ